MKKITFCFLIILFFMCQVNNVKAIDTNIYKYHLSYSRMYPNLYTNFIFCTTNNISGFSGNLPASINKNQSDTHWSLEGTVQQSEADNGFDDIYSVEKENQYYTVLSDIDGNGTNETYNVTLHRKKYQRFRIDDYSDVPSYTNYRGVIIADDTDYVNGVLHSKGATWSEPEAGIISIPVDTDVFEVVTLNQTVLDTGFYCIITEIDSIPAEPFNITIYEANGNNYGTQIGWTNKFAGNVAYTIQTVFFKVDSPKKVYVKIDTNIMLADYKYKIKCIKSKSIILVHGIMSQPKTESDVDDRKVFCNDFDLLLKDLGYDVKFFCYDAGSTEDSAILTQIGQLKSLIEDRYNNSVNQKVTLIAHSWGNILCDLCHEFYRAQDFFDDKVEQYISVGGPHSGSPIANIYKDSTGKIWPLGKFDIGSAFGCADAYKDAPEIGSSYMQYTSQDPFNNIIALNGKWESYSSEYYQKQMRHHLLPNLAPLNTLDTMMEGLSDGFIPDYSGCSTEFTPSSDNRKLVFSSSYKGMSHTPKNLIFHGDDKLHAEFGITRNYSDEHGVFITITNLLAGGTLNDISSNYAESVPTDRGAICREVTISGTRASKFKDIYAVIDNEEIKLCTQDDDTKETVNRFPKALSDGGPEDLYIILVHSGSSSGTDHDVYGKRNYTIFGYGSTLLNGTIGVIADIICPETTSTGQFSIVGGKVTIDNNILTLYAN